MGLALLAAGLLFVALLYWRYVWFFRNPVREPPIDAGVLSPADGTVVYVRFVDPGEDVVVIKKGVRATVKDIVREEVDQVKIVIGIFMSPFDVHYNRAPLSGVVGYIRHYPENTRNAHMFAMYWRTLFRREPRYAGSVHIVQNQRTVTRIDGTYAGAPLSCYVVQIGAPGVSGIDSYYSEGDRIERGATFGMIRVGSQVDLVLPGRPEMKPCVRPGDKVRAGETILVR